jgi:hypothetical protein
MRTGAECSDCLVRRWVLHRLLRLHLGLTGTWTLLTSVHPRADGFFLEADLARVLALRARDAAVGGAAIAESVAADVVASCVRPGGMAIDQYSGASRFRARLFSGLSLQPSQCQRTGRTADLGAGHKVKDEAKAGQAVHGEVEHSRGTARRWSAARTSHKAVSSSGQLGDSSGQ